MLWDFRWYDVSEPENCKNIFNCTFIFDLSFVISLFTRVVGII